MGEKSQQAPGGRAAVWIKGAAAALALAAAMVVLVTCENQDPIAPEGSTISVTASPQTILVLNNLAGVSQITATVRAKNGTRLEGQEVTFLTTEGDIVELVRPAQQPAFCDVNHTIAGEPQITDDNGRAESCLSTNKQATVKAVSGSIEGTTTVSILTGDISGITLSADTRNVADCGDTIQLTALVEDTAGDPLPGILIRFTTDPVPGFLELRGSFNPSQGRSDANGEVLSTFNIDDIACNQKCSPQQGDPNGDPWDCKIDIFAEDSSGSFRSNPETIDEAVP